MKSAATCHSGEIAPGIDAAELGERARIVAQRFGDQPAGELARPPRHLVARGFERERAFDDGSDPVELAARSQHEHVLRAGRDLGTDIATRLEAEARPVEQVARDRTERIARPFRDPGEQLPFGLGAQCVGQPRLPVGEHVARHGGVAATARLPNHRAHPFEVVDRDREVEPARAVARRAAVRRPRAR